MNILFGKLGLETNTFSVESCDFARWSKNGCFIGEDIPKYLFGKTDYTSGMMRAANEFGIETIPTIAMLDAGPLLTNQALDYANGILLDYIKKYQNRIDGICLALHGAGVAQGEDDIEAYTLKRVRELVGTEFPITITLDLHANVSSEVVALSTGIFGIKQYPHIDTEEAGYLAMKSLVDLIKGGIKLEIGFIKIPLFIPPNLGCTFENPMMTINEYVKEYQKKNKLIDATFFHGFPFSDVARSSSSVVVISDKNAQDHAKTIARFIWKNRGLFAKPTLSVEDALDKAIIALNKPDEGYVVINETSDNPGGGTPGDGTWLLRELIKRDIPKSIFGYIHDKEMAIKAHELRVGASISGFIGGKTDKNHGEPIEIKNALICALSDGKVIYNTPVLKGQTNSYGRSARLQIGNVQLVVTEELAQQTFDNATFLMVGADIDWFDIICLKSSNHFKAYFSPRARAIITADPPGILTGNFSQLTYSNIKRPIYPLDKTMKFDLME